MRTASWENVDKQIRPFYKARAPLRLRLPVTQESTKSLKTLLVLHAKTFELTKPSKLAQKSFASPGKKCNISKTNN